MCVCTDFTSPSERGAKTRKETSDLTPTLRLFLSLDGEHTTHIDRWHRFWCTHTHKHTRRIIIELRRARARVCVCVHVCGNGRLAPEIIDRKIKNDDAHRDAQPPLNTYTNKSMRVRRQHTPPLCCLCSCSCIYVWQTTVRPPTPWLVLPHTRNFRNCMSVGVYVRCVCRKRHKLGDTFRQIVCCGVCFEISGVTVACDSRMRTCGAEIKLNTK